MKTNLEKLMSLRQVIDSLAQETQRIENKKRTNLIILLLKEPKQIMKFECQKLYKAIFKNALDSDWQPRGANRKTAHALVQAED